MKKILIVLTGLLFLVSASPLYASCVTASYTRSNEVVLPQLRPTNIFVSHDNGVEHFVIKPELAGNAKDFGLVFGFSSQPTVIEAPKDMFSKLDRFTAPVNLNQVKQYLNSIMDLGATASGAGMGAPPPVTIIEEKEVGDFDVTILTANSSTGLVQWLKDHHYQTKSEDAENFEYYVSKPGSYFAALRVKPSSQKWGFTEYDFTPIDFAFESAEPIVPLRLAYEADSHDSQTGVYIYALAESPLIVPGAGLGYANIVPKESELEPDKPSDEMPGFVEINGASMRARQFLVTLHDYKPEGRWLTKLNVLIDHTRIKEDLRLSTWNQKQPFIRSQLAPTIVEPKSIQLPAGVVAASDYELIFTTKTIPIDKLPLFDQLRLKTVNFLQNDIFLDVLRMVWIVALLYSLVQIILVVLAMVRYRESVREKKDAAVIAVAKKSMRWRLIGLAILFVLVILLPSVAFLIYDN